MGDDFFLFLEKNHETVLRPVSLTNQEELFEFLYQQEKWELIFKLSKLKSEWSFKKQNIYAETCWKLGRLESYFSLVKSILEHLITQKYYGVLADFLSQHVERCQHRSYFIKSKLLYLAEIGDEASLLDTLLEDKSRVYYELLAAFNFNNPQLNKLIFQKKIQLSKEWNILNKEILEYLLLCEGDSERFMVYEIEDLEQELQELVLEIFGKKSDLSIKQLPVESSKLKRAITSKKITINKNTPPAKDDTSLISNETSQLQGIPLRIPEKGYQVTEEEKNLLVRFRYEKFEVEESYELIKSFVSMGFYTLAFNLAETLPLSDEKLYLLGEICLRKEDYSECIYYINEYLNQVEPVDPAPFLRIKKQAFLGMGSVEDANRISRELVSLGEVE